jgi:AraC-like DNA-binding protein
MQNQSVFTMINEQNGNLAFKIFSFEDAHTFDHVQRQNYFSLIWVTEGRGKLKADFAEYNFEAGALLSFSPYQPFMIYDGEDIKGHAIQFHSDFFCILKHHKEVSCNGLLFNNVYDPPITLINDSTAVQLTALIKQIKDEMQNPALAQYELLVAYLKIFLISVTRLKSEQLPEGKEMKADGEPFVLQKLKDAIEEHYKTKHSASDYADMLHVSPKALGKIAKNYFNKTLTDLIAERIIIEAKRELYLTKKPVKEIAADLGYQDEYYFSRFFKNNANISPQVYRETVGFGRGEA